ncbi:Gfo/Idh/MocA family oxidoreductase [bacterium]|nr:Gfo/Idh/MocA family oxidoreductase [bacterium]
MDEQGKNQATAPEGTGKTSRRDFMTVSGTLLAGAALSGCTTAGGRSAALKVKPMTAQSYSRILGANDRIRVGSIGTGGMGTAQIRMIVRDGLDKEANCAVTAVCDIYQPRLERAAEISGGKPFHNYQDLLASGLVDGVIIASPEHWHAQMSLDAEACGLDVYCQKPMTHDFADCRRMYERFSKSKCVFQLGTQYMQTPVYWRAHEIYQKLVDGEAAAAHPRDYRLQPQQPRGRVAVPDRCQRQAGRESGLAGVPGAAPLYRV